MRLYTITKLAIPKYLHRFERILKIVCEEHSIPNYGDITRWVSHNFKKSFILIAHYEQNLAGGAVTLTKEGVIPASSYRPDPTIRMTYLELRCCKSDSYLFHKVIVIPARERRRNARLTLQRQKFEQKAIEAAIMAARVKKGIRIC